MKTAAIGFPRIGEHRELKKLTESYFKGHLEQKELLEKAKDIRIKHWKEQNGVDFISSNDFSFYDNFLDTAMMLNIIPKLYKDLDLNPLDTYFAMAKGHQDKTKDIKALPMKKWFNTNYHYIVPEIDEDVEFKLNSKKIIKEFTEAKEAGIITKPSIIGPFTFLKLVNTHEKNYSEFIEKVTDIYKELLLTLSNFNVEFVQIDEPILVMDLDKDDTKNFNKIYTSLFETRKTPKIILQSYFGDIRDIYTEVVKYPFYGIALDFVEGIKNIDLIKKFSFPNDKKLFVGLVNGKNIWKNNYEKSFGILEKLKKYVSKKNIIINTSCSLLHVPYTLENEIKLNEKYKVHLSFAKEKLKELIEIKELFEKENYKEDNLYINNVKLLQNKKELKEFNFDDLKEKIETLKEEDFNRSEDFELRIKKQRERFNFPKLTTTTIGSFPQTLDIRKTRKAFKKGEITEDVYNKFLKKKIKELVKAQEKIGLDVLVHGEFERTDMVEYFGENLEGFLLTENAWVQSYGTRGVKPPVIFGDVKRSKEITVSWSKYAQSLTEKEMKGMLTGPITIQNWSFVREDLSLKEIAYQIALAIQEEVLDLEKSGIDIIQIDEAALREKLPLRKNEWQEYLDWAIKAFKLTNSKVKSETQIHTHMCYSEFKDIINEIKAMDADVITIEASKSDLSMLKVLKENNYDKEIGPGVYDIHSARIPKQSEFEKIIHKFIDSLGIEGLWINPDCGLKTRTNVETIKSLENMVFAVNNIRKTL